MLSEELRAQGWIEHDGGPCPVEVDDWVHVLLRDGDGRGFDTAGYFDWTKCNEPSDIIAYKPETPDGR